MEFGLAQYTSVEVVKKSYMINLLSDKLKEYFLDKAYGSDLKSLFIGIVCVSPQFEPFFKPRKPKYTKGKKVYEQEGFTIEIEKSLEYDIEIDFESFNKLNGDELYQLLAEEILKSLKVFDDMKSKIKDFDNKRFKVDIESYFKEHNLH